MKKPWKMDVDSKVEPMARKMLRRVLKPILDTTSFAKKCLFCEGETSWRINERPVCPRCTTKYGFVKEEYLPNPCEVCGGQGEFVLGENCEHGLCWRHREVWFDWCRQPNLLPDSNKMSKEEWSKAWDEVWARFIKEAKIQAGKMYEWQKTHKAKVPDLPCLPKFTIGTRVKIVRILDDMTSKDLVGTVGTVREIDPLSNGDFNYDVDGHYIHEEELESIISGKCSICGEGDVIQTEEKNHETMVLGQKVVIPDAIVGTCNKCGKVNYAMRKEVMEEQGNIE